MNKILNIILSGLLWRRYKFLIVTLILLVISIIVVGKIHQDYVEFAKTTGEAKGLGLSFIYKWITWTGLFVLFFMANNIYNKRKEKEQILTESKSSVLAKLIRPKRKVKASDKQTKHKNKSAKDKDPFDHLRGKDKLRSYAEVIIEHHDGTD